MLAVDERLKGSRGGTAAGCPQGLLTYRLPDDARHSQPAPGPVLLANATAANLGWLRFNSSTSHGNRWPCCAAPLDHLGCADHQHAAQYLVVGAGDRSQLG
jgi:hypothetical protein